ncbi:sigma-70 family RNA polymerase sigma factor [Mangrovimonas aestuarii]|uniref:sigma-70 family RNA polymerase sigma factor n=1 Tax=Mangrovimonas aestuarii TaxID=3018443 RepID=UPI0023788B40|nr:RNA polymerase sigma factor RpoD/SigA [Mangrovimonas aestuarii]
MRPLHISKQITNRDNQSLDKYLNEINKITLISAEREVQLAVRIKEGDQLALDELTKANLRFVISVAKQYQNQGLSLPDLINEGNLGLLKAARRFDETRGFKFISYAVWWIRQTIVQALTENSRIVRLPLNKIGILNKIKQSTAVFEQEHNRVPSSEEISDIIEVSVAEIDLCKKSSGHYVSMDDSISDDENLNMYNILKNEDSPPPDESLLTTSLKIDLKSVLNSLSQRESEIITLYYGIGHDNAKSLSEIGVMFNITRERVRQIKEMAIINIKNSGRADILLKYLAS